MRKPINLFAQQTTYQSALHLVRKLWKWGLRMSVFFIMVTIVEVASYVTIQHFLSRSLVTQRQYEQFVNAHAQLDDKLQIFLHKNNLLQKALVEDIAVSEKFRLLQTALTEINEAIVLETVTVGKNQEVTFRIVFPSYDDAFRFLSTIEDRPFLEYFSQLELKQFTVKRVSGERNALEFSGIFTPLYERTKT